MEERYDVFISYSSEDQKIVEGICDYLESNGYRCFVAYRDIPCGVVWAAAITDAIEESAMMVAVFSKSFNVSPQTDREIELASENKIPILTFRIADDKMTGAKKFYLKNLNWIDAFPNPKNCFGQLLDNVVKLIGEKRKVSETTTKKQEGPKQETITSQRPPKRSDESGRLETERRNLVKVTANGLSFTVNDVEFNMVKVEGGSFWMGADDGKRTRIVTKKGFFRDRCEEESYIDSSVKNFDSEASDIEQPVHNVTVSTFYMGETEVTQALWKAVMGSNPSHWKGDNLPVEMVDWYDYREFIYKLNSLTGRNFRLPTEAEWEYAARGGNKSKGYKYAGSNTIENVAWYWNNSSHNTHPVKGKSPNELGLYDMSGNVFEWCVDWYGSYDSGSQADPQGSFSGSDHVLRGGSWFNSARCCRVSDRFSGDPHFGNDCHGFRLVLPQ